MASNGSAGVTQTGLGSTRLQELLSLDGGSLLFEAIGEMGGSTPASPRGWDPLGELRVGCGEARGPGVVDPWPSALGECLHANAKGSDWPAPTALPCQWLDFTVASLGRSRWGPFKKVLWPKDLWPKDLLAKRLIAKNSD